MKKRTGTVLRTGITAALIMMMLIMTALITAGNASEEVKEHNDGWILCNPDTWINVREKPGKNARAVGFLGCGDSCRTDWDSSGEWIHVLEGDFGDGWIKSCYLTFDRVVILEEPERWTVTAKSTPVRVSPDGRIRKRLRAGTTVTVRAYAGEWALTKIGYIKTELLEKNGRTLLEREAPDPMNEVEK